ncbi:MAG: hypothetical protein M1840_000369 [Geoglossum simile]|nr:MAG: hypothetical protein M1840_000369 [Geoglossum simile]
MKSQRLSKHLSTSLSEKTFEVDSPYKARQRATIIKNSAPFLGKNYFDRMEQAKQHVSCPVLNTALTLEHIKDAKRITHSPPEMPTADGQGQRLYVELEDGAAFLVRYPEPASEAGKLLFHSGNQITKIAEKWARGGIVRELDELKWGVFAEKQIALADLGIAKLWEKDLAIRKTKFGIQQKLQNGHVFFVQKQPFFGTPSLCAYAFCPSPETRTPLGSYRLSLEPRKNQSLPTVPADPIGNPAMRGRGAYGTQWYCLTCLEDIWNGVGLITESKLAEIVADVDYGDGVHQPVQVEDDGDESSSSFRPDSRRIEGAKIKANNGNLSEFVDISSSIYNIEMKGTIIRTRGSTLRDKHALAAMVGEGRTTPRARVAKAGSGKTGKAPTGVSPPPTVGVPPDSSTAGIAPGLNTSAHRSKFLQPLSLPTPKHPYSSLSQTIYSFMLAETREHRNGYFTLPAPQHAALLKWKSTILRRTESRVKRNVFFYAEDQDRDTSHDEMYWLDYGGGHGQLVGLVDPGGLVIELTSAQCRDKELSEVFQIVDARVQTEWTNLKYTPQPPNRKIVLSFKSDNKTYFPNSCPLSSEREKSCDDTNSDASGDIPSSSSSEAEP